MRKFSLLLIALCGSLCFLKAQTVRLVADINPTGSSNPFNGVWFNGKMVFIADDGVHGRELWAIDPANDQPYLIKDLNPGSANGVTQIFAIFKGKLYFNGNDGLSGNELWATDGSPGNAELIYDFNLGGNGFGTSLARFFVLADLFVTVATDDSGLLKYYMGTGQPGQIMPLIPQTNATPGSGLVIVWKERVFLIALTPSGSGELWSVGNDGQPLLHNNFGDFFGGNLRFEPSSLDRIYIRYTGNFTEFWGVDNPLQPAKFLGQLPPGTTTPLFSAVLPTWDKLLFAANNPSTGGLELWYAGGNPEAVQLLKDINPSGDGLAGQTIIGGRDSFLYFVGNNGVDGRQLWRTDATAENTKQLAIINPEGPAFPETVSNTFAIHQGRIYFAATGPGNTGREPWRSDETQQGTTILQDINPLGSSNPRFFFFNPEKLLMLANDGVNGEEIWVWDENKGEATIVADINPVGSSEVGFFPVNSPTANKRYFRANDNQNGAELWVIEDESIFAKEPVADAPQLEIYPNPSSSVVYLQHDLPDFVTLRDPSGRLVRQQAWYPGEAVDMTGLPAGIYILRLLHGGHTVRVVKVER